MFAFGYLTLILGCMPILLLPTRVSKIDRLVDPMLLVPLSFSLASLCAFLGYGVWHEVSLSLNTAGLILAGVYSLWIGMYLMKRYHPVLCKRIMYSGCFDVNKKCLDRRPLESSGLGLFARILPLILLAVCILSIILKYLDIERLVQESGFTFNTLMEKIIWVRSAYSGPWNSADTYFGPGLSPLNRTLEKIVNASGYASVFILTSGRERVKPKTRVQTISWVSCLLIASLYSLMSGARYNILCYFFAAGFLILLRYPFSLIKKMSGKQKAIIVASLFSLGFCAVLVLYIGSKMRGSTGFNGFDYVTSYLGAGIPSLQTVVDSGGVTVYPGAKTFNSFFALLSKLGIAPSPGPYANDFVMYGSLGINVYTCFYRYWCDFGVIGVLLLSSIAGAIYELIYLGACNANSIFISSIAMYVSPSLFDLFREDYLFSQYLSAGSSIVVVTVLAIIFLASYGNKANRIIEGEHIQRLTSQKG